MKPYKDQASCFNKIRKKLAPAQQRGLMSIESLTGEYSVTSDGLPLLRYDNLNASNRILIFYSDRSMNALSKCSTFFSDGTFDAAPKDFMQMYTIHGVKDGQTFPAVCVFSEHRDEETYRVIFDEIKKGTLHLGLSLDPKKCLTDFETAAVNAIKYHWPRVKVKGCWFHFSQAIYRKAVKVLGKQKTYGTTYRRWVFKFITLALTLTFYRKNRRTWK